MNGIWLERSAVALTLYFLARTVGRYRGSKKQQAALRTPLVDAAVLEAVFHPRAKDGDDPDLLAELRDTFAHLNRQAWAEEFWDLHTQIAALSPSLGPAQNATLRRVVLRLLTSDDRWLQAVATKTAADLGMTEAVPALTALLEREPAGTGDLEVRFRLVLEDALATLTGAVPQP
jgi:hypothetical protein